MPVTLPRNDRGERSPQMCPSSSTSRLSRLTVMVLLASFVAGIIEGSVSYARRSSVVEQHVAGTNAIAVHVGIAVAATVAMIAIRLLRSRRPIGLDPSLWIAPFSTRAVRRLRRTFTLVNGSSLKNLARILTAALLLLVLLYAPYRMGEQIVGGLNPNSTVNAWGGPTYLGALLAHWLDSIVGYYCAAFLLSRVVIVDG